MKNLSKDSYLRKQKGQALVSLLLFMIIAITVTTAAVAITINNSLATTKVEQGKIAYTTAEAGTENALIQFLRNPFYTGEILSLNGGTATITVTGTNSKTIRSVGRYNNFERIIEVQIGYTNNIMTIQSWKEVSL